MSKRDEKKRPNLVQRLFSALAWKNKRAPHPLPGLREDVVLSLVHVLLTGPAAPRSTLTDHASKMVYLSEALNLSMDQTFFLMQEYEDALFRSPFNFSDYNVPMQQQIAVPSATPIAEINGDTLH